jgi:hypothetical protein
LCLPVLETDTVTSTDERDARIRTEYYAGTSAIELGVEYGLSRSQIHRIVAAGPPVNGYSDDDLDDEDVFGVDDYEPVPPFVFVGLATPEDHKGNPLGDGNGRVFGPGPRAIDGRGVSVSNPELEIWRWCTHAEAEGDFDAAERVRADWPGQLAAAGVRCDERGRWVQDTTPRVGPMR